MIDRVLFLFIVLILPSVLVSVDAQHRREGEPEALFKEHCASCHGRDFNGGATKSLLSSEWLKDDGIENLIRAISDGRPDIGMPAWKDQLQAQQIRSLAILIREETYLGIDKKIKKGDWEPDRIYRSEDHDFSLQLVGQADSRLWALDFLPDGSLLSTQHDGKLWRFKDGLKSEIKDIPPLWHFFQGGLMDILVHPDYEENGWIYLTLSEKHSGQESGSTTVVRGKIKDDSWTGTKYLFRIPEKEREIWAVHWGSRLLFKDGYLYFSYGDGGEKEDAQNLRHHGGKIHRIHEDGQVPSDNPFVGSPGILNWLKTSLLGESPTVWSYGHRNPQGLAKHPVTQDIWSVEHGPRGGDELNLVLKGKNYGWPEVSHGLDYGGDPVSEHTSLPGMEAPKRYWIPSIGPGAVEFYSGDKFPKWKNNIFVAAMTSEELHRIEIDENNRVINDEVVLKNRGRVREVVNGPDGFLYIILNSGSGHRILRLVPENQQ